MFLDVFGTLGETDGVLESSQTELEKFVCCMCGKPSYTDVCLIMPLTTDSDDDEEKIHVASLSDIIYDDDFKDNSTSLAN